jgi:hypothetical protein
MKFLVADDGKVTPIGVDMGSAGVELWHVRRNEVIWKWKGASGWSGRGEQSYHATTFVVGRVISIERMQEGRIEGVMVTFEWLYDFPMRTPEKDTIETLARLARRAAEEAASA